MTLSLKSCPFCGGAAVKGNYNGDQISCPSCHVGIRIKLDGCQYALHKGDDYDGYEAVYQAIQLWNRRSRSSKKEPLLGIIAARTVTQPLSTVQELHRIAGIAANGWPGRDPAFGCWTESKKGDRSV